jgi:LCP family protein required for cell wall assembly
MPGIDMELPGEDSPVRGRGSILRHAKMMLARKWAFRGLAACLALFIIGGGLLFSQGYLKMHKVFRGGTGTAEALKSKVDPNLLKGEGSGRINVLLLGRGGGAHDAPDLTDTIMLASIDPINHKTTLFSVPRDLWVNVPSAGNMKINAVYQTGVFNKLGKRVNNSTDKEAVKAGFKLVDQTVEDVMGVNVDYNVMIDFAAFSQAIDTVGGLNVNVPADLVDPTMAWENKNDPVLAKAGPQVFDGKHALTYVRSRETSSDFARSQRQRAVLVGLKTKIDTLGTLSNPKKIAGLVNAFGNNAQTDLSLSNASRLYGIIKKIGETSTSSIGFADPPNQYVTTGNITGQSVVLPKAGLFKYSEMQAYVRSQLKDPYILKENAKVLVLNGTTIPGVATAKAEELRAYGYNVIKAGETPTTGWTQTMLVDLSKKGRNKYTSHYLERRLGVNKTNSLPDSAIPTNGADFVIIVGSDKATP